MQIYDAIPYVWKKWLVVLSLEIYVAISLFMSLCYAIYITLRLTEVIGRISFKPIY
jgi:hypothetical protein